MQTIEFAGIEFPNADEAIQHASASGRGVAIRIDRRTLVVEEAQAERLKAAGAGFAYLCTMPMADGSERVVTIPVH